MLPIYHLREQTIAVFGLGRSGMSTARAAQKAGAKVIVYDGNDKSVEAAVADGFAYRDLSKDGAWEGIDQLIVSPGISHLYPAINPVILRAMEAGIAVDNDISLFFKEMSETYNQMENPPRVIAITGSNGKSTTTALLNHCLAHVGQRVQMGGNIGRGVFDLDPPKAGEIYVLELSSYQTDLALQLTPDVAIFTNISPDHLDRHAGMGGYFAAKAKLFLQSLPRSIIGIEEPEGLYLENQLRAQGARVQAVSTSTKPQGRQHFYHVKKGQLAEWNKGRQAASIDLREMSGLPGAHNWQNAACVFGALRAFNIAPKLIEAAMKDFPGLAHRCQILGEVDGIKIVNDSKATNADAAYQSLSAFNNIHWIAGGIAKEGGIEPLVPLFDRVKHSYLIGQDADKFARTLSGRPFDMSENLETALLSIKTNAVAGDVVLLAPACASFDQFPDFEKRGEAYISLVKSIFGV